MTLDLDSILEDVEKTAGIATDGSRVSGALRAAYKGFGGFVQGMRNTADDHRAMGAMKRMVANPSISPNAAKTVSEAMAQAPAHAGTQGVFRRMADEVRGGAQAAQKAWHSSRLQSDAELLQNVAPNVAAKFQDGARAAANVAADAGAAAAPAAAKAAPGLLRRHAGKALGLGGLGLGGYAAYRGSNQAAEQDTRATDYINNARHDAATPMPSMTVTASYDDYEKRANNGAAPNKNNFGAVASKKVFEGMGNALASKFINEPVDALHKHLKKTYVEAPKWENNFHESVKSDPELNEAYQRNPEKMRLVFESVKRYSPSLAKDRMGTQSVLRHALVTDFNMDWNTMKAIAEIEKLHAEGKRK